MKHGKSKNNDKLKPVKPKRIADRGVRFKSEALLGKKIAVAVSGGIASVESIKIIRELRRHKAEVVAFFTPDVLKFITELPVEWASGNKVITDAKAEVDHLEEFDLVLVVPATLNTLSKAALGLADNVVTLLIASQIGKGAPLVLIPTMNSVLKAHPVFEKYQAELESWGAEFLISDEEEDRFKIPSHDVIADKVLKIFAKKG